MGRKPMLTPEQEAEALRRVAIEGLSIRAVAKEYGISEAALRAKISAQSAQVKTVANQIVATEAALKQMPISAQITTHNLASKLRAVSDNLASAAMHGAATAHRLHALANSEVSKIDDADPLSPESVEALKGVAALTKLGNDSAHVALNLLAANKETVQRLNAPEEPENQPKGVLVVPGIMADPGAWAAAVEKAKPKA